MHTFSGIPMVISVLRAGDAFINLSGLGVEPVRKRHIVSACSYFRLTCLSSAEGLYVDSAGGYRSKNVSSRYVTI